MEQVTEDKALLGLFLLFPDNFLRIKYFHLPLKSKGLRNPCRENGRGGAIAPPFYFDSSLSVRHTAIREMCDLSVVQASSFFKLRLDQCKEIHDGLHESGPVACLMIMHPQGFEDQRT